jgi:DNA primase
MVASIALIPDSIQRSIFIKECAEIMDTEVELLSAEVIRKRMGTTYDSNTNEFVRNQQMQQKVEQKELTDIVSLGKYKAGSSMSELEKELVGFLIKYGHCSLDYRDGRERIHFNVAHTIINDIEGDGVTFLDARYRAILECYKQQRELLPEGEKVPEHFFIEMENPEASSAAVDILTENDHYKQSRIWKDHDIYIESEEERLGRIIPKTILLYKSKYIEVMIEEKQRELAALDDESDEYMDVLTQINNLLAVRTKMAEQTERNIL